MTDAAYPAYIKETLPASQLGYATNNRYPHFPPKMQDGRSLISSWTPESVVDQQFWKEHENEFRDRAPLNPNWMYRRYLQKTGYETMAKNFLETANDTGFSSSSAAAAAYPRGQAPVHPSQERNTPFLFNALNDQALPQGYESSDLKSLYMTREQLDSRKYAPVI